jgi:hypothetical protein
MSLAEANPELIKEWHPTRNGKLSPNDVTANSCRMVWWMCRKDASHVWQARVFHRNKGTGCPYCSGRRPTKDKSLAALYPKLTEEWDKAMNGDLSPWETTVQSNRKVWWRCPEDHRWQATVYSRTRGCGCPYCAKKLATEYNNLRDKSLYLAEQWHPTKNGDLTPDDVLPFSKKVYWWRCDQGHEWQASIAHRYNYPGCPFCTNRQISKEKSLAMVNPKLAAEWHPHKNRSWTPYDVFPNSMRKVWWQCQFGHVWQASCNGRSAGNGCPFCNNERKKKKRKS